MNSMRAEIVFFEKTKNNILYYKNNTISIVYIHIYVFFEKASQNLLENFDSKVSVNYITSNSSSNI